MRLTFVNYIVRKRPHGYMFRGKYRIVKKVELPALREKYIDYERQEQNMLYLRHPYLTVEQSKGHMTDFKETWSPVLHCQKIRNEKFARKFTWAEQLSHLRVRDAWE